MPYPPAAAGPTIRSLLAFTTIGAMTSACTSASSSKNSGGVPAATSQTNDPRWSIPEPGARRRVGGDLQATTTRRGDVFRCGPCVIDTALPVGYPDPTPPGAIDLKTYPSVRRAVVQGSGTPNRGMDSAFWPLFNHIKDRNIAMTSPVEMDFPGRQSSSGFGSGAIESGEWSMAFLYRTPELNAVGTDGTVIVSDTPPVTVLAIGMKGDYGTSLVARGAEQVEQWLAQHPEWEVSGSWRALYYNGPTIDFWNKWAEVQIPVRKRVASPIR